MDDRLIEDLRRALRREMLVGDWSSAGSRAGSSDLVIAEFSRTWGEGLLGGITFVVARWRSLVQRDEPVRRAHRTPLTVSTLAWVEYPAAAGLLTELQGAAGPPVVERFLDRIIAGPVDGETDLRDHAAVAAAARELATTAHDRGGTVMAQYATVDALVAEWRGTLTVEPESEREWVPVALAAAGRAGEARAALHGYVRASRSGPVEARYRTFAAALVDRLELLS